MSWGSVDEMDRTAKLLLDLGLVNDPDGARRYMESLVLQVSVGPEIETDPAAQAALDDGRQRRPARLQGWRPRQG